MEGEREDTALGNEWLADHDIRPMAEVAVYGGNDPRVRRDPSRLFHNHEPEEQQQP